MMKLMRGSSSTKGLIQGCCLNETSPMVAVEECWPIVEPCQLANMAKLGLPKEDDIIMTNIEACTTINKFMF